MSRERTIGFRERRAVRRRMIITLMITAAFVLGAVLLSGTLSSAHESRQTVSSHEKYYKSIRIKPGDTLWGIAEEHMTCEYATIQEYIDEIKEINHLKSDTIYDSGYLMIVY